MKGKKCNKKILSFFMLTFILTIFVYGIKISYAYYHQESDPINILANNVGDFSIGDGDINVIMFKENDQGQYVRTYSAPAAGYVFDNSKTRCTITCVKDDSSAPCNYSYNESNRNIALTSNERVTCKFYFNQTSKSDIDIYIMIEDANGTHEHNENNYTLVNNIPAFGYEYISYSCKKPATVSYDSELRKFAVQTSTKNECYAYFDESVSADIVGNVYVQSEVGGSTYSKVETIPVNKKYKLSTSQTSSCTDPSAQISYVDGNINITNITDNQTCNIYLDIDEN